VPCLHHRRTRTASSADNRREVFEIGQVSGLGKCFGTRTKPPALAPKPETSHLRPDTDVTPPSQPHRPPHHAPRRFGFVSPKLRRLMPISRLASPATSSSRRMPSALPWHGDRVLVDVTRHPHRRSRRRRIVPVAFAARIRPWSASSIRTPPQLRQTHRPKSNAGNRHPAGMEMPQFPGSPMPPVVKDLADRIPDSAEKEIPRPSHR